MFLSHEIELSKTHATQDPLNFGQKNFMKVQMHVKQPHASSVFYNVQILKKNEMQFRKYYQVFKNICLS